jgi:tagatose-1,6-bisphosphate aldolase
VCISCVSTFKELRPAKSDLILFPEYCDPAEVREAAVHRPEAVVVAALKIGKGNETIEVVRIEQCFQHLPAAIPYTERKSCMPSSPTPGNVGLIWRRL